MFTLWYTVLSWREYSGQLCAKLNPNCPSQMKSKSIATPAQQPAPGAAAAPVESKKKEGPSRIPVSEPAKTRTPSPKPPPLAPGNAAPLLAPAKPARTPSPNPPTMSLSPADAAMFDDIDFEDDGDGDDEEDSPWSPAPAAIKKSSVTKRAGDFLQQEISTQKRQFAR